MKNYMMRNRNCYSMESAPPDDNVTKRFPNPRLPLKKGKS